jgi:O-succinylhomoserine sulfhydrylase
MDEDPQDWDIATRLVRGGLARSPYGETAEAMYLTQSFVYASAEAADARFSGADPGFIYSRYGNPTVQMFEERLALAEGAEYCRATASGMAAVHLALTGLLKTGDHVVAGKALFGSCAWILKTWAPRFGIDVTLVDAPDLARCGTPPRCFSWRAPRTRFSKSATSRRSARSPAPPARAWSSTMSSPRRSSSRP